MHVNVHFIFLFPVYALQYDRCNNENINRPNFSTVAHALSFTRNAVFEML